MENLIIVVRVLLQNDKGETLFIKRLNSKRWNNTWSLPGGKVDVEEGLTDACVREVYEETGLKVFDLRLIDHLELLPNQNEGIHYLSLYFKCQWSENAIKLNEESSEYRWVKSEEIDDLPIAFNQNQFIKQLLLKSVHK